MTTTEDIFNLDSRIRYVAVLDGKWNVRESRMRKGIFSLTPDKTDRDFVGLAPPIMMGAAEKLEPFCGAVRRISIHYEKVMLVFYRAAAHVVVLSLEPSVEERILDEVGGAVRKLELES